MKIDRSKRIDSKNQNEINVKSKADLKTERAVNHLKWCNGEMVLSNPIVQKSPYVFKTLSPLGSLPC